MSAAGLVTDDLVYNHYQCKSKPPVEQRRLKPLAQLTSSSMYFLKQENIWKKQRRNIISSILIYFLCSVYLKQG